MQSTREAQRSELVELDRQNFSLGGAVNVTLPPTTDDTRYREDVYAIVFDKSECLGHINGGSREQILRFANSIDPHNQPDELRIYMSRRDKDISLGNYLKTAEGYAINE